MRGCLRCWVWVCAWLLGCGGDPGGDTGATGGRATKPAAGTPRETVKPKTPPQKSMEMVGDVGLLPLALPDLKGLSSEDKQRLVASLRAVKRSREVHLARLGPAAERSRRILSGIIDAGEGVPAELRHKILPYAARFALHGGPVDAWTGERFRPTFIPGELAAAAEKAIGRGIDLGEKHFEPPNLGANRIETLDAFLSSVRPLVFGRRARRPAAADAGATNDDDAVSRTRDVRDKEVLSRVADALTAGHGKPGTVGFGEAVGAMLTKGDDALFKQYVRGWIRKDEVVASLMGYVLPEGTFGGFVAVRDDDRTPMVRKVASEAAYFDRHLPGNAMFRRPPAQISVPNAGAYHLVGGFGAMGTVPRPAFSLPLPVFDMGQPGQRTLMFTNVLDTEVCLAGKARIRAFSATDEIAFRRVKWQSTGVAAFHILKHVIGFQAGTRPPARKAPASEPYGNRLTREETGLEALHADLVALYYMSDPKVQSIGLVPEMECAHAIYDEYVSRFVEQSVPSEAEDHPVDPDRMARRIAVRYAVEKGAVVVDAREGRFYATVVSHEAFRLSVGWLLADVQRMISLNDLDGFSALMAKYGGPPPRAWQEDVSSRLAALGLPPKRAIVYPDIAVKQDAEGKVTAVTLRYPKPLVNTLLPSGGGK